jgi:hypothetical protein
MITDSKGAPFVGHGKVNPAGYFVSGAPTRQMIRAYMRIVAFSWINQRYGVEPRPLRRKLALARAKNKAFIEEIRNATKAW